MLTANNGRQTVWIVLLILLLALGSRLFFALRLENKTVWSDEQRNLILAQNLEAGKGYTLQQGQPTAIVPVAYPLWLGLLRFVGLDSLGEIRLVQILVSFLTLLLCAFLAHWLMGPGTALWTLLLCGFYPYFIFLPGTILATTLYCILIVAAVLLYLKALSANNNNIMFFAGMVWGVAILSVTTAGALVAATLVWHLRHAPGSPKVKGTSALYLLSGLLLIVTPWLVRNQLRLGQVTLATNGGYNLWLGNHPASSIENPNGVPTPDEINQKIVAAPGNQELYADHLFTAEAGAFIRAHPGLFLQRTLLKAAYFWRLDPSPVTASYVRFGGVLRRLGFFAFAPLLILAFWGYYKAPAEVRKIFALWIHFAVFYTLIHAVMIVKVRFRLPIDQFLIIAAAFGGAQLWQQLRGWRKKS